jgi:putative flippase GtrA
VQKNKQVMRDRIRNFFSGRAANPAGQFVRYLIAGGLGAVIELLLFALLAWKAFPALREDEWVVRLFNLAVSATEPAQRALNFAICISITFVVSNLVVYFISVRWVFIPGRHSRRTELALFYGAALLAYLAGTSAGSGLIALCAATGTTAYLTMSAVSILINYAARKFIVFKR